MRHRQRAALTPRDRLAIRAGLRAGAMALAEGVAIYAGYATKQQTINPSAPPWIAAAYGAIASISAMVIVLIATVRARE